MTLAPHPHPAPVAAPSPLFDSIAATLTRCGQGPEAVDDCLTRPERSELRAAMAAAASARVTCEAIRQASQ